MERCHGRWYYTEMTLLTRKCRALSSLITGIELLSTRQPVLIIRARDTTVTSDLGVSRVPGELSIYVTVVLGWMICFSLVTGYCS